MLLTLSNGNFPNLQKWKFVINLMEKHKPHLYIFEFNGKTQTKYKILLSLSWFLDNVGGEKTIDVAAWV